MRSQSRLAFLAGVGVACCLGAVATWRWIVPTVAVFTPLGAVGSRLAPGVSRAGLTRLRPGMTEAEVRHMIGEPLSVVKRDSGLAEAREAWLYGTPSARFGGGAEIVLTMRAGQLARVMVEVYDLGVYWCNEDACPVIQDEKAFRSVVPG